MKATRLIVRSRQPGLARLSLFGASLLALVACSAGDDEGDGFEVAPFGNQPGAAGAQPVAPGGVAPGVGGAGNVTPGAPLGNAGAGSAVGGAGGEVTPGAINNGAGGAASVPAGNAGTGQGGSASVGQGGGSPVDPNQPPPSTGPGRAGAELCPAGPFGSPLPANPQVTKLFSVGENNFFNFEGPVWVGNALFFSEISGGSPPPPANINRFVPPNGMLERGVIDNTGSNGLGVDAQGNLIAATHDIGAISSFQVPSGARGQVGAQTFNGARFNSPNDLVQRLDGNVYFTDPSFQAPGAPQGGQTRVYRISPEGEASVVDATIGNPNGITLSPDGNTLYVTGGGRLVRYALAADGTPGAGQDIVLSDGLQTPDGMGVDCAGNIYTTEHDRRIIRVIAPNGTEIGRFGGPQAFDQNVTNVAFGGPNRTTLFVTTLTQGNQGGLFAVELGVPGLPY
jgi:gluconolactonase